MNDTPIISWTEAGESRSARWQSENGTPPPIRYFDRHMKGGFGVMWDDILAAFYTLLLFALWRVI